MINEQARCHLTRASTHRGGIIQRHSQNINIPRNITQLIQPPLTQKVCHKAHQLPVRPRVLRDTWETRAFVTHTASGSESILTDTAEESQKTLELAWNGGGEAEYYIQLFRSRL